MNKYFSNCNSNSPSSTSSPSLTLIILITPELRAFIGLSAPNAWSSPLAITTSSIRAIQAKTNPKPNYTGAFNQSKTGNPNEFLGVRVASVDYNGEKVLKEFSVSSNPKQDLNLRLFPKLVDACERIEMWLKL